MSEIQVERSDQGVATLWLSNPRHLNALSNAMIIGLCEELSRLADDMTCRAIVMRGRGGVYCAGRELAGRQVRCREPTSVPSKRCTTICRR